MRKFGDYLREKIKKDPDFAARYDLLKEKAAVVKEIIENEECTLPAALVRSTGGITYFVLDKPAASLLSGHTLVQNLLITS